MKVTILNGNPDASDRAFEDYLSELGRELEKAGHGVETLNLRELDIKPCLGCFGCWVKTPGRCAVTDDSPKARRAYIGADLALFASPVRMGFTSALLKRAQDKLIPLLMPYIAFSHGECHHTKRYTKYPKLGLLLERRGADDEDLRIITDIYGRMAWNFKSELAFAGTTECAVKEVADAVGGI
jgi:multimeric flavodoxin WrbA